ncbi:MAG: bifunctional tetrahydrofolate synthase/dihydrofolate synthase [Wenzhouxiangellaceae bacterium]
MPANLQDLLAQLDQRAPSVHIELGLDRVRRVLARLAPALDGARVITVGGTNGKGSTVAFLEAIAAAAGRRCLAYTSPHLIEFNERFRLDGQPLDDDTIADALTQVETARGEIALTWFEQVTLATLVMAGRLGPEWLLLEVGLGGRLDAVNVVDPDVAVITSIGLDHQDWLGRTRAAIAREKCGIARAGRPVVVAERNLPRGMIQTLEQMGAEPRLAGRDLAWRWRGRRLEVRIGDRLYAELQPSLSGAHQAANVAAAMAAALALEPALPEPVLATGVRRARLPGRFQTIAEQPRVVVDVAHNPAAARVLSRQLRGLPRPRVAVFGAYADKDAAGMVRALRAQVDHWLLIDLPGPRGRSAAALLPPVAALVDAGRCEAVESASAALARARSWCGPNGSVIAFGSFATAEAVVKAVQTEHRA